MFVSKVQSNKTHSNYIQAHQELLIRNRALICLIDPERAFGEFPKSFIFEMDIAITQNNDRD